ncbi:acyltransferase family protein [Dermatobacter hominis]|uniref:acyltransferase family protein n=1 Tax=Dermatobacter hominis TaxID=2884263 RepID=UPI001D0F83B4|nr:acyltransferase family protein [Dermatobacter hominis]UDY37149.1 acyltransferase [Dermatobacter hominis]
MQVDPAGPTTRIAGGPAPEPLGHVPALDGLRAFAVAAVLLFHGGISGLDGGFLGVSVFFTLSGFLITSLLLREWAATADDEGGGIDLRRFWSRRFRRLLAASWLTMGLVVVMGALGAWDESQLRDLRGDVPWAIVELVNWHFIAQGTSYGASQSPPSPLEHFWSLAIEQQFYLLLPVLLMGVLAIGRRRGAAVGSRLRTAALVLAGLAVASAVANGVVARTAIDRAYFGTDTRAAELLIGVLLAFGLLRRVRFDGAARRVAVAAGVAGTAVLLVLFHVAELTSPWLYPWGLLLTAACTAGLVAASVQTGPVSTVLAVAPVVALGRISYGVYLLHWPVFLWLTPARTGLDGGGADTALLFALRIGVTLATAAAMFRWVEMPVRTGGRITARQARVAIPCAAVVLVLGDLWVTRDLPPPPDYLQPREAGDVDVMEAPTTTTTTVPTTLPAPTAPAPTPAPPPTPPPRHPTRVLLVGDSVAASMEDSLGAALNDRGISFATSAAPGCGVVTGDPADAQGNVLSITTACNTAIPDIQRRAVREVRPDLVVVLSTWETGDRVVDGRWYQVGTPETDALLRRLYGESVQRLTAGGARVLLLTIPDIVDGATKQADPDVNRRAALVNPLLTDLGATVPGVDTLGFDRIVCPTTPCPTHVEGIELRPRDGRHFDEAPGRAFVTQRLADQIAALDLNAV